MDKGRRVGNELACHSVAFSNLGNGGESMNVTYVYETQDEKDVFTEKEISDE